MDLCEYDGEGARVRSVLGSSGDLFINRTPNATFPLR